MIKKANPKDFEFFFSLKCEPNNIYWCGYCDKPDKNNLRKFWDKYFAEDSLRDIYIVWQTEVPVGYLYIDYLPDGEVELSIAISMNKSGKGYGTEAIEEAVALLDMKASLVIAYIREDNEPSQRLFSKVGFQPANEFICKNVFEKECEKVVRMYKWKYSLVDG